MKKAISDWKEQVVSVTLHATHPVALRGVLREAFNTGVLLELDKGLTFVPVTSILHISESHEE